MNKKVLNDVILFYEQLCKKANRMDDEFKVDVEMIQDMVSVFNDKFSLVLDIAKGKCITETMSSINFPNRFLKIKRIDELSRENLNLLNDIIDSVFYLGLAYHLLFETTPSRKKYFEIKESNRKQLSTNFIDSWVKESIVADHVLKDYCADIGNIHLKMFNAFFELNIKEKLYNSYKFRMFKKGLSKSYFKNIFFMGILFAMELDVEISKCEI